MKVGRGAKSCKSADQQAGQGPRGVVVVAISPLCGRHSNGLINADYHIVLTTALAGRGRREDSHARPSASHCNSGGECFASCPRYASALRNPHLRLTKKSDTAFRISTLPGGGGGCGDRRVAASRRDRWMDNARTDGRTTRRGEELPVVLFALGCAHSTPPKDPNALPQCWAAGFNTGKGHC